MRCRLGRTGRSGNVLLIVLACLDQRRHTAHHDITYLRATPLSFCRLEVEQAKGRAGQIRKQRGWAREYLFPFRPQAGS
jgi:hypothetical protein